MKHIAILLPGIIRNYVHLNFISKIQKQGELDGYAFHFFGYCYNFLGNGRDHWHFKREYLNRTSLDKTKIECHPLTEIRYTDEVIHMDRDGFDGRIFSQWNGIKQSFKMCEKYSIESGVVFDLVVRARWDIDVVYDKFIKIITESCNDQKLKILKYKTITDQGFMGPLHLMKRVCMMADDYYEILELEHFVELQREHLRVVKELLQKNPAARDPRNAHVLRFEPQSEKMLTYYVDKQFDIGERSLLGHRHRWWTLRRD